MKTARKPTDEHRCHDCGVLEGELHRPGCDMEFCPFCGGQLITCPCWYTKLGYAYDENASFCGLPPKVYVNALSDQEEARFMKMCDARGRVPYVWLPLVCGRCGELWPTSFMVDNKEWLFYLGTNYEGVMLCPACYDEIKRLIDTRSGLKKYPLRVTETLAARESEWRKKGACFSARLANEQKTLVDLGLKEAV